MTDENKNAVGYPSKDFDPKDFKSKDFDPKDFKSKDFGSKDFKPRSKFDPQEVDDKERMKKWQTLIDKKIRKAIGDGNVAHLSGAGKPLNLNLNDDTVPEDLRVAYKIMRDNDVVPAWIALRYVLDDKQAKIRKRLRAYAHDYHKRLQDAMQKASFLLERDAEERWQSILTKMREEVDAYNHELLDYNLTVPPQVGQRRPLIFDEEIRRARDEAL